MQRTILILASSIRRGQRCFAGREVDYVNNEWQIGSWIRPVSTHGEGEVPLSASLCSDGTQPSVLDIVTITLATRQECTYQPENYIIDISMPWKKRSSYRTDLSHLIENPSSLWDQPQTRSDRIHVDYLNPEPGYQSLYLIRPDNLYFCIWTELNQYTGAPRKRRRALFTYAGSQYNLPITDPTMDQRYFTPFPSLENESRKIKPANPQRCLLVVSLGAPFTDGFHYKLVPAVIDF